MFEFLEALKSRQTFFCLSEFSIDLTQDVVVLGGRWTDRIGRDRIAKRLGGLVPFAQRLVSTSQLVIGESALRVQFDCLLSILQSELGFAQTVVIGTQVDVGGVELETFLVGDLQRLVVGFQSRGVVSEGLVCET